MNVSEKLVKSYLPMSEQSFLILHSMLQERHGYGIMQFVAELTAGRVQLGASTVYTILYKMENDGLIDVTGEYERRKVYVISPIGMQILSLEAQRVAQLSQIAYRTMDELSYRGCVAEQTTT